MRHIMNMIIDMKLEQKRGLQRRNFEIIGDKIKVIYKTSSETKEWTVNIDAIGHDTLIEKNSRKGGIILGAFLLAFGVFFIAVNLADKQSTLSVWAWIAIGLFYLLFGTLIFIVPVKKEIHLIGGASQLTFFLDSPSREQVDLFIKALIEKSKKILLDRYAKVDPDLPEDTMMNQLIWLRNRTLITDNEYIRLKNEYKTRKIMN